MQYVGIFVLDHNGFANEKQNLAMMRMALDGSLRPNVMIADGVFLTFLSTEQQIKGSEIRYFGYFFDGLNCR